MNKKRIHDLDLIIDSSEISETDYLIVDDENEESSKKISVNKLFEIMNSKSNATYTTYGVSIDLSESDPEKSVTYTDDAIGKTPGSNDWFSQPIFKDIKPCLFKDGEVKGYLNPTNFAQFEDESDADITSGNEGDVMIEIPKIGYKIVKNGTTLTVQITDDPNAEGFSYKAHTRIMEGDREKLYIGAFLGSEISGKLHSLSDKSPIHNIKLSEHRAFAKENGKGYDLLSFYPLTLLQCLYLIMYKNLNSQEALGMGYVNGVFTTKNTGATVDKGMNYGSTDDTEQMKFLGIEDFWGNFYQLIDGFISTTEFHALVATDNFSDSGDGYTDMGVLCTERFYGYMTEPRGDNNLGFIAEKVSNGSSSTYFSDDVSIYPYSAPIFGGCLMLGGSGSDAGAFFLSVYHVLGKNEEGTSFVGSRLMYL